MARLIFNICLLLLLSCPAWAEEGPPPFDFKGIYDFQFSGIPLARLGVESTEWKHGYHMTADVTLEGIAKLFTRHTSHTTVEQTNGDRVYDTHYQTKKKKKAVKLVYKNGKIIEEVIVPPEGPDRRPPVPAKLKNAAYDPLTLNLSLRRAIWQALKTDTPHFSLTVFDGRRLTQVDVTIAGKKNIVLGEVERPAIKVAIRRKLLNGYTESEIKDYSPKEPTLWIYYDEARLVPLKIEMGFLFGKITGTLAKECRTGESCLLGIKE